MTRFQRIRGTVMLISLIMSMMVMGLSMSFLSIALRESNEAEYTITSLQGLNTAEAGISEALAELNGDLVGDGNVAGNFSGKQYTVTCTDNPDGTKTLKAVASMGQSEQRIVEVVLEKATQSRFKYAMFGDIGVHLDSNGSTDSYDSAKGSWSSQITGKWHGTDYANYEGDVGSNGSISLDSNAAIFGDAACGADPDDTTTVANPNNQHIEGSMSPASENWDLPPVELPAIPVTTSTPMTNNAGEYYQDTKKNDPKTLGPGNYHFTRFEVTSASRLTIQGPATIVADYFEANSNVVINIDATNGPVKIVGTGDFIIDSNVEINSSTMIPSDLSIELTTNNNPDLGNQIVDDYGYSYIPQDKVVKFASNSTIWGTIYAPNSWLDLRSNNELFGAVVGKYINVNSNMRFHYDEQLGNGGSGGGTWRQVSWRELAQ